jgi:hypothetical protein
MPANSKRGSPSWKQLLFLIVFGAVVCYTCDAYGNFDPLTGILLFVGLLSLVSGFGGFLVIALKEITSSTERTPANAAPPRALTTSSGNGAAALVRLRITVIGMIALACFDVWHWGGPALNSSYGRSYWTEIIMTLLLSQLPYVAALIRIRRAADHAGLALIMAAGVVQSLFLLRLTFRYPYTHQVTWPWLTISLGLAAGVLAGLAWHSGPSRKGEVGVLLSMFFSFVAYTVLSGAVIGILRFQLRKLH